MHGGKRQCGKKNGRPRRQQRFEQSLKDDSKNQLFGQGGGHDGREGDADDRTARSRLDQLQKRMLGLRAAHGLIAKRTATTSGMATR